MLNYEKKVQKKEKKRNEKKKNFRNVKIPTTNTRVDVGFLLEGGEGRMGLICFGRRGRALLRAEDGQRRRVAPRRLPRQPAHFGRHIPAAPTVAAVAHRSRRRSL